MSSSATEEGHRGLTTATAPYIFRAVLAKNLEFSEVEGLSSIRDGSEIG
jgi:hypothetical protein